MIFAHVNNGMVVNVSIWDGESEWAPSSTAIPVPDGLNVGIGWSWDGFVFISPEPGPDLLEESP